MDSSEFADYELSELLNEVFDKGYIVIYISKLWRLLGKGSRAAGTWKALLAAWEKSRPGNQRDSLHICELPSEYILITKCATKPAIVWAQETGK